MGVWTAIDEPYLLGAMPTALRTAYDAWLAANPAKDGRLAALAAGVVADFREGLRREGAEALEEDTATLPERCARHAVACVCFHLAVEMGAALEADALREFEVARAELDRLRACPASAGTPRYGKAAERPAREADGL